jgi:acetate CoA/acetoacetate CoA-transferase beta subunit
MAELSDKEVIAQRAAQELKDGDVVNLGIGLPTLVSNFVPEGIHITLQAENGILGMGPSSKEGEEDNDLINAGGAHVNVLPGACFFDSATSFAIIRGGHVDITVLGALQVDAKGNIASHMVPGKMVPGMGGAMDLVAGANKVIVAMQHTAKGKHKIMKECSLPLTGVGVVDLIVTDMGVMEVIAEGLLLKELRPGVKLEDFIAATDAELILPDDMVG